jgi:hypothetical protein
VSGVSVSVEISYARSFTVFFQARGRLHVGYVDADDADHVLEPIRIDFPDAGVLLVLDDHIRPCAFAPIVVFRDFTGGRATKALGGKVTS